MGKERSNYIRKVTLMHILFGIYPQHRCKTCSNFKGGKNEYKKCSVYGETRSLSSDWVGRWIACGMYNTEYEGKDVITIANQYKKTEVSVPMEGQIEMKDCL